MWAICKKEIRHFFNNPFGYVILAIFLLINGFVLFVFDDNILDFGYATLESFFQLAPWLLLLFIPAITMHSFSEEIQSGTFEILQTKPLKRGEIIAGKYFGNLIIVLIGIFPTLLYLISIQSLSSGNGIDTGATAGSYIGLFFLAAVFTAIGICSSSFTKSTVVAMMLSLFICGLLFYGFNALSRLPFLSRGTDYYVEMLGIDFHYRNISRGLVDTRDLIYFLSVIGLFFSITFRKMKQL